MRRMVRRLPIFVLLVAVFIAAEPVLHSHPLQGDTTNAASGSPCAICATHTARPPVAAPVITAPQVIVYTVATPVVTTIAILTPAPRASRAPPSA